MNAGPLGGLGVCCALAEERPGKYIQFSMFSPAPVHPEETRAGIGLGRPLKRLVLPECKLIKQRAFQTPAVYAL